jgi:hypothetical protein
MSEKKVPKLSLVDGAATPPRPLGHHGAALWRSILNEFEIDDAGGREMLCQACEAADRVADCSAQLKEDGTVLRTRGGVLREHPACRVELANRGFVVRTLSKLGLGVEPTKPVGRPPMKSWPQTGSGNHD